MEYQKLKPEIIEKLLSDHVFMAKVAVKASTSPEAIKKSIKRNSQELTKKKYQVAICEELELPAGSDIWETVEFEPEVNAN